MLNVEQFINIRSYGRMSRLICPTHGDLINLFKLKLFLFHLDGW